MSSPITTLSALLARLNLPQQDQPIPSPDLAGAPWYIQVIAGIGAWFSALFLIAAVTSLFFTSLSQESVGPSFALIGGILLFIGLRAPRKAAFTRQFRTALLLGGHALVVAGVAIWGESLFAALLMTLLLLPLSHRFAHDFAYAFLAVVLVGVLWLLFWIEQEWSYLFDGFTLITFPLGALLLLRPIRQWELRPAGYALLLMSPALLALFPSAGVNLGFYHAATPYAGWPTHLLFALIAIAGCRHLFLDRLPKLWLAIGGALATVTLILPLNLGAALTLLLIAPILVNRVLTAFGVLLFVVGVMRFYLDLEITLLVKSLLLFIAGSITLLLAVSWRVWIGRAAQPQGEATAVSVKAATKTTRRKKASLLIVGLVLVLGLVNGQVWIKQRIVEQGVTMLLPLRPVDPRSLIQGDYMRLRYRVAGVDAALRQTLNREGTLVVSLDEQGIVTALRAHLGEPLAADEHLLRYRQRAPRRSRNADTLRLAPDAFFFQEGDAEQYERARYSVVQVAPDGHAVLVGLADETGARLNASSSNR